MSAVLVEARRRAPSARVLAVGYPAILPTDGTGCWPVEPVVPTAPAAPVHPNALGMWGMKSAVAAAVDPAAPPLPPPGPTVEVGMVVGG